MIRGLESVAEPCDDGSGKSHESLYLHEDRLKGTYKQYEVMGEIEFCGWERKER